MKESILNTIPIRPINSMLNQKGSYNKLIIYLKIQVMAFAQDISIVGESFAT